MFSRIILFQRGATGWGFSIGRLYWQIDYPSYWFLRGKMIDGTKRRSFGHWGWDRNNY